MASAFQIAMPWCLVRLPGTNLVSSFCLHIGKIRLLNVLCNYISLFKNQAGNLGLSKSSFYYMNTRLFFHVMCVVSPAWSLLLRGICTPCIFEHYFESR